MDLARTLDVATSLGASAARLGTGMSVAGAGARPAEPLELYEFEACPFCRKAREALSILDLDAMIYPCPKGGSRFREEVRRRGGKAQFPYLVDPNTGQEMYESDDIVRYLFSSYRDGSVPWLLALAADPCRSGVGLGVASGSGETYRRARAPERPLELWSFEASPFSRLVREELCTLEVPYLLHNVARGSAKRDAFVARSGKMMVPYLADPNTGQEMFESADIVRYLRGTYAQ
jgi:glutathione S-transferase